MPSNGNVSQGNSGKAILFSIKLKPIGWSPQNKSRIKSTIEIFVCKPHKRGETNVINKAENKIMRSNGQN